jgi:hypothetical protein
MQKVNYSFKKGFSQVQIGKSTEVKEKLMSVLSITTRASWSARLKGKIVPKVDEAKAIENVFAGYGIKNVWGE